ncbi:DUF2380 domain-containing protein [Archangium lansingense]|uniref:DUF2380 domain-containing protein n=1 Tax=Archangium lansingense TaxID=2995310 RepID=A0ABT4AN22_9BACT|nr:DUF2380 domain-containing protein [Archangium lansinium]MCY1083086.1 DUF2380 domain-containing protein [Archangium lansinium]
MPSTLLVLLSQAEAPGNPPAEEMEPPRSASAAARWRYLPRLEASGLALIALALLSNACVSLTPRPGPERSLRYTPRGTTGPAVDSQPPSPLASEAPGRLHHLLGSRETVTGVGLGGVDAAEGQNALAAHLAFHKSLGEVSGSTHHISRELSRLRTSHFGIAGAGNGLFVRYVDYGEARLRWMDAELASATELATIASEMEDPDMQLALLRLAGPRLEAAMMGSLLLAVWVDFLSLADATLSRRLYSEETLYVKMERWRKMLEPSMAALSSLEPEQVESAAEDMPALVGHLTGEFSALLEALHKGAKVLETALVLKESMEALTMMSALKFTLPALRAATPAMLGVSLMVGPSGVMMGTRMVVSAEWVEMMRQLVRAGVLSVPAVGAVVRIQAGHVMMAQGHDDLPRGMREALGDAPEVRAMRVTGKTGAGMAEPPRHHVMPKEFREWFEKRGFTGKMSIEWFCVTLQQAHHQAIHGGGDWKLGRKWPGEWNQMLIEVLRRAESRAGRMLTRNEVLEIVAERMGFYDIPMNFVRCRGK